MGNAQKNIDVVSVEVLQNGHPVAEYSRTLNRRGPITLGPHPSDHLHIPLYRFDKETDLLRIEKDQVQVRVDPGVEGFAILGGESMDLLPESRTTKLLSLKRGDRASFALGDLQLSVKVGSQKKVNVRSQVFPNYEYKRNWWREPGASSSSLSAKFAAFCCASVLTSSVCFGLLMRPDDRAESFVELPQEFTLRFISPKHFLHAPEALQEKLNRADYVGSIYKFISNLGAIVTGHETLAGASSNLLLPTSVEHWRTFYADLRSDTARMLQKHAQDVEQSTQKSTVSRISMQSALAEDVDQRRMRLLKRLNDWQQALKNNLEDKRRFIEEFKEDQPYDFGDYKNAAPPINKKAQQELAKIKVFNTTTDEETMYLEAKSLAKKASILQANQKTTELLSDDSLNERTIVLPKSLSMASFLPLDDTSSFDDKINQIEAQPYGTVVKKTVLEPLIGQIDENQVQKVITKNKFQLQLCFELALRRDEQTRGNTEWAWRIDSKGKISDLNLIQTNIGDRKMLDCLRQKIASWSFPKPRNGSVEIRYPFQFSPSKG